MEVKSTIYPFLNRVAAHMHAQWGNDFRKIAVVFNNKRPIDQLKKALAKHIQKPYWSPQFYTIQDFIRKGHALQEANAMEQFFLLYHIHTELQRAIDPSYEASMDHFFPLAEIILSDFSQLDYDLVSPEKIFTTLENIAEIQQHFDYLSDEQKGFLKQFWNSFTDKKPSEMQKRFLQLWQILPRLYHEWKKALSEEGKTTMASMYKDLVEQKANTHDPTDTFDAVLFVGFNALNACEAKLFKQWQDKGKAYFYFDADSYYLDDPLQEAGHFLRKNLQQLALRNALEETSQFSHPHREEIDVFAAPGMLAQAKVVQQLLENTNPDQPLAIILADESLLIPVLQQIPPDRYEQLNITMGIPGEHAQSLEWIKYYLEFQAQLFNQKTLWIPRTLGISILLHPWSGLTTDQKENLLEKVNEQVGTHFEMQLIPKASLSFPTFFDRAKDVAQLMQQLRAMTETLLDVKPEQAKHLPMEYAFLKKALQEIVTLEKGFSAQEHLSIPLALKLIKRSLQALRAVVIGDPMAPIQIMGLLETRSLHFDRVIMLGVNEGVLPATSPSPSLIPDNLRRAFDLPVIYNQQALSAYLFYRLVGQAQKTQLVYNRLHDGWSIGEPSRFIRQLSYESPLQLREQQVVLPDAPPVEERHIPLTEIAKKGEVWTKLQDYFSVNGQKPKRTLSASAFTLYLQSPLEFFYKYIAGIPEPPQLKGELEANTLGSMLHKVMELCYLEEKEKGIILQKDDILAKKQHLKAFSLQALKEQWPAYRLLHPELTGSEHILVQMTEKHAQILLEHDAKEVAPFQIIELENETDYHMPLPLQLPQQEVTVWLKGIIDRVDQCEEGFRIVDYKTGKDELVVKQKGKDDLENLSFFEGSWDNSNKAFVQTLYYTLIYEYCTGTEDVVPHVYSTRRLHESPETSFCESIYNSRSAPEPIKGPKLAHYKQVFYRFIQSKLEELFNPEIPFKHDPTVKIYPSSPYWNLVMQQALLENEEDADNPAL